ncbi:cadherin-like domain-containing protein, partial [Psychrobacter cibarius]
MKKLLLVTLLSSLMVGCGSDDSSSNAPVINNTAPTASDTQVDATENTLMSGTLSKAIDADGDKLTYTLTVQAANGEANVNPNGTYTYMPNPDFHGEDSFAYSVSDGRGGKITRKAIINVSSVNQAPSASGKRDGVITLESSVVEKSANILLNT